jgi:hypothetical protein
VTVLLPETYPAYAGQFQLPVRLTEWMDLIVNHYASLDVSLPGRRYWTIGRTAHDCEQAVLAVQQYILGTAAAPMEPSVCNGPRAVTFTFEVIRCAAPLTKRGDPPAAGDIEVASVDPAIDMEIMMDLHKFFADPGSPVVVTVDAISESGGMHGAIATYTVDVF